MGKDQTSYNTFGDADAKRWQLCREFGECRGARKFD